MIKIKISQDSSSFFRALDDLCIEYKRISNAEYITINNTDFEKIREYQYSHIEIQNYLKQRGKSKSIIDRVIKRLSEEGIIEDSPESIILGQKYINCEHKNTLERILDEKDYLNSKTLANKYKVPVKSIRNNQEEQNGKYSEAKLINQLEEDSVFQPIEDLFKKIESQEGIIFSSELKSELINRIKSQDWKIGYKFEEFVVKANRRKSQYKFHVNINDYDETSAKKILEKLAYLLPADNYVWIWNHVNTEEKELLKRAFGCIENSPNDTYQPYLHKIMSLMICEEKEIKVWTDSDVDAFCRKIPGIERYLKKLMRQVKKLWPEAYYTGVVRQFRKEHKENKYIPPYSLKQYLKFGALIFYDEYFFNNIMLAIKESRYARALFFSFFQYAAAWRTGDVSKIFVPTLDNVNSLIEIIRSYRIPTKTFEDVWISVMFYTKNMVASKNNEHIETYLPVEFYAKGGVIVAIAEFWRIQDKRETLYDSFGVGKKTFIELFGNEYISIFGNKKFSQRRLNKDLLIIYANGVKSRVNLGIRTLPNLVAAIIRGHKIRLEQGQITIMDYIGASSDGLSLDEVSYELFEIGTMGFYKDIIAEIVIPEYKKMMLKEKRKIITVLDIVPRHEEVMLQKLFVLEKVVSQSILAGTNSAEDIICRIMETLGDNNAIEKNVYCLYTALTGYINPECRNKTICNSDKSKNGLCPFGIYFCQVLEDRLARVNQFEKDREYFERKSRNCNVVEGQIYQNEIQKCDKAIDEIKNQLRGFSKFGKNQECYGRQIEKVLCERIDMNGA